MHVATSEPDGHADPAARARVDSYPVVERFGWVWVFLGDRPEEERPPLPELPEFEKPGWRAVHGSFLWKAGFSRVVENTVDVAHTPFVHRNSFGNSEDPTMPDYEVVTRASGVEATVTLASPEPRGLSRLVLGPDARNTVGLVIDMVSFNRLTTTMARGWGLSILFAHTPVDEHTTLTRFIQVRNFLTFWFADGFARRFSLQIIREDQAIVEAQTPQHVPTDGRADLSLRSDALSLAYRALLALAEQRGDRIDQRAVRRAREEEVGCSSFHPLIADGPSSPARGCTARCRRSRLPRKVAPRPLARPRSLALIHLAHWPRSPASSPRR